MKPVFLLLAASLSLLSQAQLTPTPDKLWGKLFEDVQMTRALGDNKTFVDMVPQHKPAAILKKYASLKKKGFCQPAFFCDGKLLSARYHRHKPHARPAASPTPYPIMDNTYKKRR